MRAFLLFVAAALVIAVLAPISSAYDVVGTVFDPQGEPVDGASVWLSQDREVRVTQTDPRGRFSFTECPAGAVGIVARKEGLALAGAEGQIVDDVSLSLQLLEPDAIRVRVIDPSSEPVEGARLKLLLVASSFHVPVEDLVEFGFPSVRSDADGFLVVGELPKDSHASFSISHRAYAESELPTLPVGSELDIRLQRGARLHGRVSDHDGSAVARARVSVFRGDKEFTEVLTDGEGFYSALLPIGEYFVAARHRSHAMPDPISVQWDEADNSATVDLQLPPPHTMRGATVDTAGEPVAGSRIVYIARDILFDEVTTDVTGAFQITVSAGEGFLRVIPPLGMYTVSSPEIPFELSEAQHVDLESIALAPLPNITGTIEARKDAPADRVLIATLGMQHAKRAVTDAKGNFSIQLDAMPIGDEVQLRAEHAFRFLRRDFTANIRKLRPETVRLREFEPNLAPAPPKLSSRLNQLHHMVGDPAPALECDAWFNVPESMGEGINLDALRGKVVVLTLWGGWDRIGMGPDRTDELNRLYELFRGEDDVFFVTIHDGSASPEEVTAYVKHDRILFPVGHDAEPALTFDAYNVNTIPQTVLIDREGILRYFDVDGRLLELIKSLRRR